MKITYGVDDGYAGKDRPQHVNVPDDEISECETMEEIGDLIWNCINCHFEQNVVPYFDFTDDIKAKCAALMKDADDEDEK